MTPLPQLVACAERELALRRRVYPKWVLGGRMAPATAERETQAMADIVDTLKCLLPEPQAPAPAPQPSLFADATP